MKLLTTVLAATTFSLMSATSALADRASGSNVPVDETAITRDACMAKGGHLTRQAGDVYCAYVDAAGTKRFAPLVNG